MTKTIHLTFTDAEWAALSDVAVDPKEWLYNAVLARATAAAYDRRNDENWNAAVIALGKKGGNVNDNVAILAEGIGSGMFKDAARRAVKL